MSERFYGLQLIGLAQAGSMRQFYLETAIRPFKFASYNEQQYWLDYAEREGYWSKSTRNLVYHLNLSQTQSLSSPVLDRFLCLGFAANIIITESAETSQSQLRVLTAGEILRNLAWYNGPHLERVVKRAEELMDPHHFLLTREAGVGAIKNAAHYRGIHIPNVVGTALTDWPNPSVRIRNDQVRALSSIAKHSKSILQTQEVRRFLDIKIGDENTEVTQNAVQAYNIIFN